MKKNILPLPRGLRNCNPGNIRHNPANKWLGMAPVQTDPSFVQYVKMSYGYRALMRLLQTYSKQGFRTISDIIHRWAPMAENDTEAYIRSVVNDTGLPRDHELDTTNQWQMIQMAAAISHVENGEPADFAEVDAGWRLLQNADKAED